MRKISVIVVCILILGFFHKAYAIGLGMRLGQGGLIDDRAEDGKLGGDQLALDIKVDKYPIVASISYESHKKSPVAIYHYEIANLIALNIFYIVPIAEKRLHIYLGGGTGGLEVPKVDVLNAMERGILFDLISGINIRVFWRMGFYIEGMYIYSSKTRNNTKVIDFSDVGALVGISFNFGE